MPFKGTNGCGISQRIRGTAAGTLDLKWGCISLGNDIGNYCPAPEARRFQSNPYMKLDATVLSHNYACRLGRYRSNVHVEGEAIPRCDAQYLVNTLIDRDLAYGNGAWNYGYSWQYLKRDRNGDCWRKPAIRKHANDLVIPPRWLVATGQTESERRGP
jgi:hypothetical protein